MKTPISIVENIDCIEGMKQFPDIFFELAICDIPYGLGDKLTQGGTWASKYKKVDADWDILPSKNYFDELFRVSKNQIIWGGNYVNILPASRGFIIWDKVALMDTMADCEFAWSSFDKNAKIFRHVRNTSEKRIHITQKPIALYTWLLENYAKQGDKILDTHLGSQSSRIAAYKKGFDFWGFGIDKDYFQQGNERFEKSIAMPLFDTPVEQKQLNLL